MELYFEEFLKNQNFVIEDEILELFIEKLDRVRVFKTKMIIPANHLDTIKHILTKEKYKEKIMNYFVLKRIKGMFIEDENVSFPVLSYSIKFNSGNNSFYISPYYDDKINTKKEEENNMFKILEIYKEKRTKEIEQKYDKQLEELEANDQVTIYIKQAEDTLKEMLNTEEVKLIVNTDTIELTKETIDKREEIIKIIHKEKQNLKAQISEIEALLELAPNYEEKVQILKDYGIMDKKKNVIL